MSYAPLWVKSNFSFLEGASHPEEYVARCAELGLGAFAVTDRDAVYGIVRAHAAAQEFGGHPIVGAQMTLEDGSMIVLLVCDRNGYRNLCRLISTGRLRSPKGMCSVTWPEVCGHAAGLMALWGGADSLLCSVPAPDDIAGALRAAFADRLYVMIPRHRQVCEIRLERRLRARAAQYELPTVAVVEVLYHTRARRPLQDVLTCIRHHVTLDCAGRLLKPNAEHVLPAPAQFAELFHDDPASVKRTLTIAAQCTFSLSEMRYRYPAEDRPGGSLAYLRKLTYGGARGRYGGRLSLAVTAQLERELTLIDELDYCGYFLTMHEIVEFCRAENILCQGRGSAANSIVCYCLGITAVDPVRLDLLFERFISRERAEPPDIDLDIEHNRREEVIQHVYQRYGRTHAAMVASVICYRQRSAIREVGKVLGLPETALDRFARQTDYADELDRQSLSRSGLDPRAGVHERCLQLSNELLGFPRHLSIHPGGFLLGHEPVHDLVPIENGTMADRTVIQWDKNDVETLGLFKVDLLGLGTLTHLHECFDLLRTHYHAHYELATVPAQDARTFRMIQQADTVGVFQIESRAQMSMLPRLLPATYYDLVIQVSIIRPGPIVGGMVHPYLNRRAGREEVVYPHPSLVPVLEKTLGVPLFQEQVMKLAMVAADYTPGEADQLRRDMAAWQRTGRMERHRQLLVSRMVAKGICPEFAARVFQQISGFGEYGFPESHAASFALIAYCGAWLKCHYREVFTTALLNAQPMGFYSPSTIVDDAKRHGVTFLPIDVSRSAWDCTLEKAAGVSGYVVRMGLRYVRGLGERQRQRIEAARADGGFATLEAFRQRTRLNERALASLAEAGAFEGFEKNRRRSLWNVYGPATDASAELALAFGEDGPAFSELDDYTTVSWDYHATGHSTREHPLEALRDLLIANNYPTAAEVTKLPDGTTVRYAGVVICRQRPSTARGVVFVTLEDETGFVNLILWPQVVENFRVLMRTESFLGVSGQLQSKDNVVHIVVKSLWRPRLDCRPPKTKSRDFR